ncbi:MAG: CBS domain-containing protein [Lysobacterales bacterium]|jgi:CBS domain-containing protein|nr:MAG: CBS domain-containing protein [Xanthomonadales bacterium]RPI17309.1 MAG: CBS domain-containing protein [Xanthomonadales bacterium]
MVRVKHLLARKGREIWTVDVDEPVLGAIQIMADRHVGALPVLRDGQLAGIVSERDYARKVILLGRSSAETPVWQIMSSPVVSVGPEESVRRCMELMTERRIRHLPVVEAGRMVGVISIGDLVRAVIEEQEETIAQLEKFIAG